MNTRPSGRIDHAVAEHVPGQRLRDNRSGFRIPHGGLIVRLRRDVARSGHDQHFAVVHQAMWIGLIGISEGSVVHRPCTPA